MKMNVLLLALIVKPMLTYLMQFCVCFEDYKPVVYRNLTILSHNFKEFCCMILKQALAVTVVWKEFW